MYAKLCSWPNLFLAWRKAAEGKRGQPNVARFEHHLEDNLLQIQAELRDRRYMPGSYESFYVHEPKRRLISAAPFRDRVVHHALCNLIEPIFERTFIADSYANRQGKGTHRALDRVQQLARRFPFVLQCDVRQFFPSIDHQILLGTLASKIAEPHTLDLIGRILAGGQGVLSAEYTMVWFPEDELLAGARPRGLPIGNLTSQLWANCYLNPFDHFVKRELRCSAYVRYVDDFLASLRMRFVLLLAPKKDLSPSSRWCSTAFGTCCRERNYRLAANAISQKNALGASPPDPLSEFQSSEGQSSGPKTG